MTVPRITLAALFVIPTACGAGDSARCKTDTGCGGAGTTTQAPCGQGVCAESGPGPKGCFAGQPATTVEYLNACTSADTKTFDNCTQLGLCAPDVTLPAPLPPPALSTGVAALRQAPTVRCANVGPNVVYLTGEPDFATFLGQLSPLLAAGFPPYRAVFMPSSSCTGVDALFKPASSVIKDVPATATTAARYAFYFDDDGSQVPCTLDPEGKTVDIGVSSLFSTTCDPSAIPGTAVAEYPGPVASYGFAVPAQSRQTAISVEAAHLVFGLGGQNPAGLAATPWTDPAYYFIDASHASTALAAELIHVPRTGFWGNDQPSIDDVRDRLVATARPDLTIGILPADYADKNRGNLRILFLQGEGQMAGVVPDSDLSTFDKANVRDGHYLFWGYLHFYVANLNGSPSPAATAVVARFTVPLLDRALVDAIIDASLVPRCAMRVDRQSELGPLEAANKLNRCDCYFQHRTTDRASCPSCATSEQCPATAPSCNYGFCEAL